jgi:hypothetical protein
MCFETPAGGDDNRRSTAMPGLNDEQKIALTLWYGQPQILDKALSYIDDGDWSRMEDYLHRDALIPIARIDQLPEFMRDENGTPLFPTGINPATNFEVWQDAIEIGWKVMESERGINHDRVHKEIAKIEKEDWDRFVRRAEQRTKGGGK